MLQALLGSIGPDSTQEMHSEVAVAAVWEGSNGKGEQVDVPMAWHPKQLHTINVHNFGRMSRQNNTLFKANCIRGAEKHRFNTL